MKTYTAQDEFLKSLQTVPFFLTYSSGLRTHKTSMSHHILLFFATLPQIRTSALPLLPFPQINSWIYLNQFQYHVSCSSRSTVLQITCDMKIVNEASSFILLKCNIYGFSKVLNPSQYANLCALLDNTEKWRLIH